MIVMNLCVVTAADVEFRLVSQAIGAAVDRRREGLRFSQAATGINDVSVWMSEIGAPGFVDKLARHP